MRFSQEACSLHQSTPTNEAIILASARHPSIMPGSCCSSWETTLLKIIIIKNNVSQCLSIFRYFKYHLYHLYLPLFCKAYTLFVNMIPILQVNFNRITQRGPRHFAYKFKEIQTSKKLQLRVGSLVVKARPDGILLLRNLTWWTIDCTSFWIPFSEDFFFNTLCHNL